MTYLMTAWRFAKRVPWPVWAVVAMALVWTLDRSIQYRNGVRDGREAVLAQFREDEADALNKAAKARANGESNAAQKALREANVAAAAIDRIEKAEANDTNALDALLGE